MMIVSRELFFDVYFSFRCAIHKLHSSLPLQQRTQHPCLPSSDSSLQIVRRSSAKLFILSLRSRILDMTLRTCYLTQIQAKFLIRYGTCSCMSFYKTMTRVLPTSFGLLVKQMMKMLNSNIMRITLNILFMH